MNAYKLPSGSLCYNPLSTLGLYRTLVPTRAAMTACDLCVHCAACETSAVTEAGSLLHRPPKLIDAIRG